MPIHSFIFQKIKEEVRSGVLFTMKKNFSKAFSSWLASCKMFFAGVICFLLGANFHFALVQSYLVSG